MSEPLGVVNLTAHGGARTGSGIQKYAPTPPLSLTNALGREVEKFDQLVDTIESQLVSVVACKPRANLDPTLMSFLSSASSYRSF